MTPLPIWRVRSRNTDAMAHVLGAEGRDLRAGALPALREIGRRRGGGAALRALGAALRGARDAAPLVEGNVHRKAIRLPGLFGRPWLRRPYAWLKAAEAHLVRAAFRAVLADEGGTALIFNGSNYPDSVLAAVTAETGTPRVFTEGGFFPRTLQLDPAGINAAGSVPRDPAFYAEGPDHAADGLPDAIGRRTNKAPGAGAVDLPARYVFVPFQVPSDMQVRVHSPWIRDMGAFLALVADLARAHPDRRFVVKEHPSFPLRVDRAGADGVIFANDNDTRALIEGAEAVVTLNSTVGLEALALGRPVIVLGEACYDIPGLVLRARDRAELDAALDRLPGWTPDPDLRRQVLGYLLNRHLIPGTLAAPPADLGERIRRRARSADSPDLRNPGPPPG